MSNRGKIVLVDTLMKICVVWGVAAYLLLLCKVALLTWMVTQ